MLDLCHVGLVTQEESSRDFLNHVYHRGQNACMQMWTLKSKAMHILARSHPQQLLSNQLVYISREAFRGIKWTRENKKITSVLFQTGPGLGISLKRQEKETTLWSGSFAFLLRAWGWGSCSSTPVPEVTTVPANGRGGSGSFCKGFSLDSF